MNTNMVELKRLFKIAKLGTEKFGEIFYFRTAKVAKSLPEEIDFSQPLGLKILILSFIHVGSSDVELQRKSNVYMDHFL